MDEETLVKTLLDARVSLTAGVYAVLRDVHQAEDVFQEVLIRALRMRESITDPAGLLAWARVTARNLAIDHIRRRERLDRVLSDAALGAVEGRLEEALVAVPARVEAMRHCLERLPAESRQLLRLRYDLGYKGVDLAKLLHRSKAAIYKTLSRLHQALRRCVDDRLAGEGMS